MRLIRRIVLLAMLAVLGWTVVPSVSVESNGDTLRINVDRAKLRKARDDLRQSGRAAAEGVERALELAGRKLEEQPEPK